MCGGRNITGFMGDRPSQKSQKEHAHKILTTCLLSTQELRDELFCQLCKQLTANPSAVSRANGWHLMLICLTTVAPSDELLPSVLHFFKVQIEADSDVSTVAEIALHKCFKSTQLGARHEVPSVLEMEALRHVCDEQYHPNNHEGFTHTHSGVFSCVCMYVRTLLCCA